MILTRAHVEFWAYHSCPRWSTRILPSKARDVVPSIHECVNAHAEPHRMPNDRTRAMHRDNFIILLDVALRNDRHTPGTAEAMLHRIIFHPHSTDSLDRQVWARRITRRYLRANTRKSISKGQS